MFTPNAANVSIITQYHTYTTKKQRKQCDHTSLLSRMYTHQTPYNLTQRTPRVKPFGAFLEDGTLLSRNPFHYKHHFVEIGTDIPSYPESVQRSSKRFQRSPKCQFESPKKHAKKWGRAPAGPRPSVLGDGFFLNLAAILFLLQPVCSKPAESEGPSKQKAFCLLPQQHNQPSLFDSTTTVQSLREAETLCARPYDEPKCHGITFCEEGRKTRKPRKPQRGKATQNTGVSQE